MADNFIKRSDWRHKRKAGAPYECMYSDDEPEGGDRKLPEFLWFRNLLYSDWFSSNLKAEGHGRHLASVIRIFPVKKPRVQPPTY